MVQIKSQFTPLKNRSFLQDQNATSILPADENKIPSKIDFDNTDNNTKKKSPIKISEAVGNDWIEIN